jgi:hypothetical protein
VLVLKDFIGVETVSAFRVMSPHGGFCPRTRRACFHIRNHFARYQARGHERVERQLKRGRKAAGVGNPGSLFDAAAIDFR